MNISILIEKLKSISLDKKSLELAAQYLQDKQNIDNAKNKFFTFISTKKALFIISCSSSLLIAIWILPGTIKRLNSSKIVYITYLANIELIGEKSIESKIEKDFYDDLKISQGIIENMLSSPQKLLYMPELLRQASVKTNVQLLSFKPYSSENDLMQDIAPENNPSDINNLEIPLDELDEIPDELIGSQNGLDIGDDLDTLLILPEIEVTSKIDFDIREFALDLKGDYLDVQRFFSELQNFKLLYSIKEIKYGISTQGIDLNSGMNSNQGGVQISLIIRLPEPKI